MGGCDEEVMLLEAVGGLLNLWRSSGFTSVEILCE